MAPITGDPTATDDWEFVQSRPATILFVIDDSGSMAEEQGNLRTNIQAFIDAFTAAAPGALFHMGVVTTDTMSPARSGRLNDVAVDTPLDCTTGLPSPLPKWVDESTPELARTFGCLASVGTSGFGGETALGAARLALSPALLSDPTANQGFYIPGSLLVIVVLGDEDDCTVCSGTDCGPLPGLQLNLDCSINRVNELTPIADFVQYFAALSDGQGGVLGPDGVEVAAIIGLDLAGSSAGPILADPGGADQLVPICSVGGQGSAAPAPRIESFTRSFADYHEYSICDGNFGNELGDLGRLLGERIRGGCLRHAPCPGTTANEVVVRVTDGAAPARDLVPLVDYDVACAPAAEACAPSADAVCPTGWRVDFLTEIAPGAGVQVLYGFDAGDGCTSG
jgi:hypothetical protein